MHINFNGKDLVLGCHRAVFEWEGFSLESVQNDTSLSLCVCVCVCGVTVPQPTAERVSQPAVTWLNICYISAKKSRLKNRQSN